MLKPVHKRALSLLLSVALILTALPVTALAATNQGVPYLDTNGSQLSANDATVIDSGSTVLNSGWYVVDSGDVTIDQTVTVSGDVKLILADGANLTVNGTSGDNAGIKVTQGNSLSIYAQSIGSGMGKLTATGNGNGAGIGSALSDSSGTISIYGGRITATGGNGDIGAAGIGNVSGAGASFGTIGIYGGIITATNGRFYGLPDIGGDAGNGDNILIKGGTIISNWSSHVVTLGVYSDFQGPIPKIVIDGGSLQIGTPLSTASDPNPLKNSDGNTIPVSPDALTVPGQANAAVSSISIDGVTYGDSVYTDGSGNLYLHLPAYDNVVPIVVTMDDGSKYWAAYRPTGDFPPQSITLVNAGDQLVYPNEAQFSAVLPADITVFKLDTGSTFSGIKNGSSALSEGTDYTVSGNAITIKADYLKTLPAGATTLSFAGLGNGNSTLAVTTYPAFGYIPLGDSIATGYGLSGYDQQTETPPATAYSSIVGNALGLTTGSLARDGINSSQLLDMLSDSNTQAYLSKTKVITLSIGSDDILGPFLQIVAHQLGCDPDQIQTKLASLAQSDPTTLAADLSALNADGGSGLKNNQMLKDAASGFAANFQNIISAIKTAAPDAKIYVTNTYNPYEGISIPYGAGTLNLGEIADSYIQTLNSAFSTSSADYTLIDTYSAFSNSLKSGTSLVNSNLSIYNFDPHPNAAGHAKIADMILAAYSEKSPTIGTSSLPEGTEWSDYQQTLDATGCIPITWNIAGGALPDGLTLDSNSGKISGIPTTTGSFQFTVKATNAVGSDTRVLSIKLNQITSVSVGNLSGEINELPTDAPAASVSSAVTQVLSLPHSDQSLLTTQQVAKLEGLMQSAMGSTLPSISTPVTTGFSGANALPQSPPDVNGLSLATFGRTSVALTTTQLPTPSSTPGSQVAFDLTLTAAGTSQAIHSELPFPVTITIQLPSNFAPQSGYQYIIRHTLENGSSELLPVTIGGTSGHYTATFRTSSFSTFTLVGTDNGNSSGGSTSNSSGTGSTTATTFVSDTNADFSVNGAYQFKITSKNGMVPSLIVGTPGIFKTQFIRASGNDYYFQLTAIGNPGDCAGIYVNGTKLLVATVKSNTYFVSDTINDLGVNGTYQFKITSQDGKAPNFVAGTSGVFETKLVKHVGNDYFYKITATGKPGDCAGIFVDGTKLLVATVKSNSYFASDTLSNFTVNKAYTFKITSKDGKAPSFVVGTSGVFATKLMKHVGNDYFYMITATGKSGNCAGIYVHGTKLLVATVK